MRPVIDDLDRAIVELLAEDGRMSCAQIARSLGYVSARAVRKRIKRLTGEGIIRLAPIVNPKALGYRIAADIFIQTEPRMVGEVAAALAQLDAVNYVAIVTGDRDLSIQVKAVDVEELQAFITGTLQNIPGVERSSAHLLMQVLKDLDKWGIPKDLPKSGGS